MKMIVGFLLLFAALESNPNDSSHIDEVKIARAMRVAVRQADSTLLKKSSLDEWRDYVKISTLELEPELRPLVLIKFDEDVGFRNQLKKIIEWECQWQRKETEYFVYYYHWDRPPPEIIMDAQDAHCRVIAQNFQIELKEKIPYRYDPTAQKSVVYPFDDLRGGIVSEHPFDLDGTAKALFNLIDDEPISLIEPLATIHGRYYQNPATAEAYYEMCLQETQKAEYIPAIELFSKQQLNTENAAEWYSSYCFAYRLTQRFTPPKISEFIARTSSEMSKSDFERTFLDVFGLPLDDFESELTHPDAVNKI